MRRAALVLAALIMCAALASFASCKGTSRAGNTAAPIEATNGDTENTAIKPYNRLMLTRHEEIVDDESIMLCPYVDDEEYGYISTLIAIRIRARIRSYENIERCVNAIDKAKQRLNANVNFEVTMELLLITLKEIS